jgi:hypothetical protein
MSAVQTNDLRVEDLQLQNLNTWRDTSLFHDVPLCLRKPPERSSGIPKKPQGTEFQLCHVLREVASVALIQSTPPPEMRELLQNNTRACVILAWATLRQLLLSSNVLKATLNVCGPLYCLQNVSAIAQREPTELKKMLCDEATFFVSGAYGNLLVGEVVEDLKKKFFALCEELSLTDDLLKEFWCKVVPQLSPRISDFRPGNLKSVFSSAVFEVVSTLEANMHLQHCSPEATHVLQQHASQEHQHADEPEEDALSDSQIVKMLGEIQKQVEVEELQEKLENTLKELSATKQQLDLAQQVPFVQLPAQPDEGELQAKAEQAKAAEDRAAAAEAEAKAAKAEAEAANARAEAAEAEAEKFKAEAEQVKAKVRLWQEPRLVCIQSSCRAVHQSQFWRLRAAAVCLQSHVRMWLQRLRLQQLRLEQSQAAATNIQRVVRGRQGRQKLNGLKAAAEAAKAEAANCNACLMMQMGEGRQYWPDEHDSCCRVHSEDNVPETQFDGGETQFDEAEVDEAEVDAPKTRVIFQYTGVYPANLEPQKQVEPVAFDVPSKGSKVVKRQEFKLPQPLDTYVSSEQFELCANNANLKIKNNGRPMVSVKGADAASVRTLLPGQEAPIHDGDEIGITFRGQKLAWKLSIASAKEMLCDESNPFDAAWPDNLSSGSAASAKAEAAAEAEAAEAAEAEAAEAAEAAQAVPSTSSAPSTPTDASCIAMMPTPEPTPARKDNESESSDKSESLDESDGESEPSGVKVGHYFLLKANKVVQEAVVAAVGGETVTIDVQSGRLDMSVDEVVPLLHKRPYSDYPHCCGECPARFKTKDELAEHTLAKHETKESDDEQPAPEPEAAAPEDQQPVKRRKGAAISYPDLPVGGIITVHGTTEARILTVFGDTVSYKNANEEYGQVSVNDALNGRHQWLDCTYVGARAAVNPSKRQWLCGEVTGVESNHGVLGLSFRSDYFMEKGVKTRYEDFILLHEIEGAMRMAQQVIQCKHCDAYFLCLSKHRCKHIAERPCKKRRIESDSESE